MVKSLLAERFKLTFHRETKELPVYALVTAKNGARLKPNTDGGKNGNASSQRGKITGQDIPLETFLILLSKQLDRVAVDKTGLTGTFDVQLEWSPEFSRSSASPEGGGAAPDASGPSLFTALQEQLGLKLESAKGPVVV